MIDRARQSRVSVHALPTALSRVRLLFYSNSVIASYMAAVGEAGSGCAHTGYPKSEYPRGAAETAWTQGKIEQPTKKKAPHVQNLAGCLPPVHNTWWSLCFPV